MSVVLSERGRGGESEGGDALSSYNTHARAVQITAAQAYLFMLDSKGRIWKFDPRPHSAGAAESGWKLIALPLVDEWSEEAKVNLEKDGEGDEP